jgi:hypothetical protein
MNHNSTKPRQPGDLIDRYMKDSPEEDREEARDNLRRFALLLIEVGERIIEDRDAGKVRIPEE